MINSLTTSHGGAQDARNVFLVSFWGTKMGKRRPTKAEADSENKRARARLDFKQRNISRAMRGFEATGKEIGAVEIAKDGTIRVIGKGESVADNEVEHWLSKQKGQHANQR
jgi:hypothetical protein